MSWRWVSRRRLARCHVLFWIRASATARARQRAWLRLGSDALFWIRASATARARQRAWLRLGRDALVWIRASAAARARQRAWLWLGSDVLFWIRATATARARQRAWLRLGSDALFWIRASAAARARQRAWLRLGSDVLFWIRASAAARARQRAWLWLGSDVLFWIRASAAARARQRVGVGPHEDKTMSVADDPKTFGRTRLSFASVADIDEFVTTLDRFERGELTPDQWRAFRLVRGTYGQRQTDDAQMLRVKIPQGLLTAEQLEALAEVGERYSRGFGHITPRQNVQFHFVKLHDVEHAMHRLADAGLTTREACGNSVRNITACHYAGVASDERFDVTPYAEALTRYLLRHPLSSTLPRKFKIAFEGCATDHVYTGINDLGFRAVLGADGARGFRVTAGGGTAIMVKSAGLLHEFLPASEILRAAEAVLRVFHRLGDYQHKQRNRMKFLIKTLGWTRWREEYDRELTACRLRGQVPTLDVDPPASESKPDGAKDSSPSVGYIASRVSAGRVSGPGLTPTIVPVFHAGDEAYARWRSTNVRPQKQFGYIVVVATVPLGDLTSEQMRIVGELSRAYGDGTIRVTGDQGLVFRPITVSHALAGFGPAAAPVPSPAEG